MKEGDDTHRYLKTEGMAWSTGPHREVLRLADGEVGRAWPSVFSGAVLGRKGHSRVGPPSKFRIGQFE